MLGVFSAVTENVALIAPDVSKVTAGPLEDALHLETVRTLIAGSTVVGSLACGNRSGFVVSRYAHREELKRLREFGSAQTIPDVLTATGNIILANDTAAIVHPLLSDQAIDVIAETLSVDVRRATIAGLGTVGMAGVATNKGVLVHPKVSDNEIAILEDTFGLPVDIGTVNFGSPLIGAGLLANSAGYIAGTDTTGPELGRIEDALDYI